MIRYALLVFVIVLFGAFGATEAQQEVQQQTDPTNCSGLPVFIQDGEVWQIAHPGWAPSLFWGGISTQVECIGVNVLALRQTDGGYVIDTPTTGEWDMLGQFSYIGGPLVPDGELFEVSSGVLWFSGANENENGVWGLYRDDADEEWYIISPFSSWKMPDVVLGITVNNSFIPEAVETAEGVYFLAGFDVFLEGASALHGLSSICPVDGDNNQPGCIAPEHFYLMGVPEEMKIIDFTSFGTLGRDYMLEVVTPSGAHEIWAFDQGAESFAPINSQ